MYFTFAIYRTFSGTNLTFVWESSEYRNRWLCNHPWPILKRWRRYMQNPERKIDRTCCCWGRHKRKELLARRMEAHLEWECWCYCIIAISGVKLLFPHCAWELQITSSRLLILQKIALVYYQVECSRFDRQVLLWRTKHDLTYFWPHWSMWCGVWGIVPSHTCSPYLYQFW